jgi:hypothetical protein
LSVRGIQKEGGGKGKEGNGDEGTGWEWNKEVGRERDFVTISFICFFFFI